MNLKTFNKISAVLNIILDKMPQASGALRNVFADSNAKVKSISLAEPTFFNTKLAEFILLTEDELNSVVLDQSQITLESFGKRMVHNAPNGKSFSVRDLLNAVEKTEQMVRPQTDWFGGIDCHHIYFEGIHLKNGVYEIYWGS